MPFAVTATVAQPNSPNPAWKLPILGFGPFGKTAKCVGDKWAGGHCGLKTIAKPGSPVWHDMAVSEWLQLGCLLKMRC
jgi:hypothetical protein